jgi:hypothetical protein
MGASRKENRLVRYLLGDVAESDREAIEAQYLEDEDYFAELQLAEDDLIDAYVNERLGAHDRALFEKNLITSPRQQERVRSARALLVFARKHKSPTTPERLSLGQRLRAFFQFHAPTFRLALVVGMALAIVAAGWFGGEVLRLRSKLDVAQSESDQEIREKQEEIARLKQEFQQADADKARLNEEIRRRQDEIELLRHPSSTDNAVVARLGYGVTEGTRGTSPAQRPLTISLPSDAKTIRLQLDLKQDSYATYVVTLADTHGNKVKRSPFRTIKTANGRSVIAQIPAKDLSPGDYRLFLDGVTENDETRGVSEFLIRIVRK